jgi:spermine oxidase
MDPFTRGSYSYVAAAASTSDVDVLAEPLVEDVGGRRLPVVCFAGEATSRKHIGTTSGAYFSGVREAERLIQAYSLVSTA